MVEGEEFESQPPTPESIDRGFTFEEEQPTMSDPSSAVPQAEKPRYGGVVPKSSVVWVGGPPNEDFSNTTLTKQLTALAFRNFEPVSEAKFYAKRIGLEGHSIKFKQDDPEYPLMAFATDALTHMQRHGMDTVFYMKGVDSNGKGAEELFTYHSHYTKEMVDEHLDNLSTVFDSYAKE